MKIKKSDVSITSSGTSVVTVSSSSTTSSSSSGLASHTLWGLTFNGTLDIYGDITNAKNITAKGGDIEVDSVTNSDGNTVGGNITASETITGKTIKGTTGTIDTLNSTTATITTENSTTIKNTGTITTPDLEATAINALNTTTKELSVTDAATITTLNSTNINNSNKIITKDLLVTGSAEFFQLTIDKIKSVGGLVILTPANAKIDYVLGLDANGNVVTTGIVTYRCYFKCEDANGNKIQNEFSVNDLIICQTFNAATGTSYNASNKYYWRLITSVGTGVTVNNTVYHYIDVSATDYDTSSNGIPEAGDEIAQLGNRTDTDRQSAIIISAYTSPDSSVTSPAIVLYSGVNDYNLSTHKMNLMAKNGNSFKGNFQTTTGSDIETLITNVGKGTTAHLHTAYSNSSTDWSKTYDKEYLYLGMCSNYDSTDTSLAYSDYTWVRFKGLAADSSAFYKLVNNGSTATVDVNKNLILNVNVSIASILGDTVTALSTTPTGYNVYWASINSSNVFSGWTNITSSLSSNCYTYKHTYENNTDKVNIEVDLNDASGNTIDSINIPVTLVAGASFSITDSLKSSVLDNKGNISTLQQTATNIQLKLNNTGIDIEKGKISGSANQFVLNDTSGNKALYWDSTNNYWKYSGSLECKTFTTSFTEKKMTDTTTAECIEVGESYSTMITGNNTSVPTGVNFIVTMPSLPSTNTMTEKKFIIVPNTTYGTYIQFKLFDITTALASSNTFLLDAYNWTKCQYDTDEADNVYTHIRNTTRFYTSNSTNMNFGVYSSSNGGVYFYGKKMCVIEAKGIKNNSGETIWYFTISDGTSTKDFNSITESISLLDSSSVDYILINNIYSKAELISDFGYTETQINTYWGI